MLFRDKHSNFLGPICKLDHLIRIRTIIFIAKRRSSLEKGVSKFTPKKIYEIDSRDRIHKTSFSS